MAGDYSRIADGIFKHFDAVRMQQGRVHLDSDWNALVSQIMRRWQTQADDTFGPAAVPAQTTPNGFLINGIAGPDFSVGAGRCYVDGLQAELFANETVGGNPVTYLNQPFLPNPPAIVAGSGLVYLDVWEREVTAVQDPWLLDVALGGADTTTRLQTVWQVKLLQSAAPPPAPAPPLPSPLSCSTNISSIFPPSAGQLSAQAVAPVAPTDPCILPDRGGYRGIENRLYRVEIHTPGNATTARWKWSRENASIVSKVTAINNSATSCTLTVDRIGRDDVLCFSANDWVELIDDQYELAGVPGFMAQIVGQPDPTSLTITLDRPLPTTGPAFDTADTSKWHTRLIRWDQSAGVDSNGLLSITAGWMPVEDGVEVQLTINASASNGQFNVGDYWCIAARTANASVEPLTNAPPLGIYHHYCVLATYSYASGGKPSTSTCRTLWPPTLSQAHDCCCTVCVDAADHNSNTATIGEAIKQVSTTGGRVCLGPGVFLLDDTTVALEGLSAVTLSGQGPATTLLYWGNGPAVEIDTSIGVRLEDLNVIALAVTPQSGGGEDGSAAPPQTAGIVARNSFEVAIDRCLVAAVSAPSSQNPANPATASPPVVNPGGLAIALDGFLLELAVQDNVLVGDVGIGKLALLGSDAIGIQAREVMVLADAEIAGNWMPCGMAGIALMDQPNTWAFTVFGLEIAAERNRILGCSQVGIAIAGVGLPDASIRIAANHVDVAGSGIYCATDAAVICDNFVTQAMSGATAATTGESGILIGSIPGGALTIGEVRILRNRVNLFGGYGITVGGLVNISSIIANAVTFVLSTGISITGVSASYEAIVRDNEVMAVVPPTPATLNEVLGPGVDASFLGTGYTANTKGLEYTAPAVSGISISSIPIATVQNNTVAQIGTITTIASTARGIELTSVQTATISGNNLCDIGLQTAPDQNCYGIRAWKGFTDVGISGNAVRQSSVTPQQAMSFCGIFVDITSDNSIIGTASLDNNAVSGSSSLELVLVETFGDCLLNGNRCTLAAPAGRTNPVVKIATSAAVIAGNNRISSPTDTKDYVGLDILAGTRGQDENKIPNATVTGNIVSGLIHLNNSALAAPWAPLNLQA